jgi:hypothetical protein
MGHYFSEMVCQKCMQYHCICKRTPDPNAGTWVIQNWFPILYEKAQFPDKLFDIKFKTEEEAKAAIPGLIQERIDELELTHKATIKSLKQLKREKEKE